MTDDHGVRPNITMAKKLVVTLRLPPDQLKQFSFPVPASPAKPEKKRARPKSREPGAGRARPKSEGASSTPVPVPIIGNLPRSVKAAPQANMSGLDLDKTPSRKWVVQAVPFRSLTGFEYEVGAWCSTFKPHEIATANAAEAEPKTEPQSTPAGLAGSVEVEMEPVSEPASEPASEPEPASEGDIMASSPPQINDN